VLEGLTLAADAFRETPGYLKLVQNPAVPREERLAMLDEAFGAGVHVYVLNFLKILCGKSALGMAAGCLQEYKALLYEARGILPVQAVSAVPLDVAQRRALCDSLAQKTGRTILLETAVDPSVLGGVKLRYEGLELDGTAAGRLAALRRALTQA
ncbi:MAG: ATP synthase F1 subunit delta, partial [Ruthenibacterium lactatiformans]